MKVSGVIWFTTLAVLCAQSNAIGGLDNLLNLSSSGLGNLLQLSSSSFSTSKWPLSGLNLWQIFKNNVSPYGSHTIAAWIWKALRNSVAWLRPIPGWIFDGTLKVFVTFPLKMVVHLFRMANVGLGWMWSALYLPIKLIMSSLMFIPGSGILLSIIGKMVSLFIVWPLQQLWQIPVNIALFLALIPAALVVQVVQIIRFFVVGLINLPVNLAVTYADAALAVISWWT